MGRRWSTSWPAVGVDPDAAGADRCGVGDADEEHVVAAARDAAGPGARPVPRARAVGHVREPAEGRIETSHVVGSHREGQSSRVRCAGPPRVGPVERWARSWRRRCGSTLRRSVGRRSSRRTPSSPVRSRWRRSPQRSGRRSREGKAKDDGLYYDHRKRRRRRTWRTGESLLAGLEYVYGDSAASRAVTSTST